MVKRELTDKEKEQRELLNKRLLGRKNPCNTEAVFYPNDIEIDEIDKKEIKDENS
jgi:hypothetical protein